VRVILLLNEDVWTTQFKIEQIICCNIFDIARPTTSRSANVGLVDCRNQLAKRVWFAPRDLIETLQLVKSRASFKSHRAQNVRLKLQISDIGRAVLPIGGGSDNTQFVTHERLAHFKSICACSIFIRTLLRTIVGKRLIYCWLHLLWTRSTSIHLSIHNIHSPTSSLKQTLNEFHLLDGCMYAPALHLCPGTNPCAFELTSS
jgi:hypothetical protein